AERHTAPLKLSNLRLQSAVPHRHPRAQPYVLRPRRDDIALDVPIFLAEIAVHSPTRRAVASPCRTYAPNGAHKAVAVRRIDPILDLDQHGPVVGQRFAGDGELRQLSTGHDIGLLAHLDRDAPMDEVQEDERPCRYPARAAHAGRTGERTT